MFNSLVGYDNIVPLLAPADITTNAGTSGYMDIKYAHNAAFLVSFGALTTATAADVETVTVESASAVDGAEVAVDFTYRLSGAVGANTWGAVTAATSAGVAIASTDDNKLLWVEVDPAAVQADNSNARYIRVVITPTGMTNCIVGVVGMIESRYKQTTHLSATGAASA